MTALAQQVITPVACDPNHVSEIFTNGPMSIQGMGPLVTITFTSVRPADISETMAPTPSPTQKYSAVVVSRLTMPTEVAVQLKDLLNRTFVGQPPPMAMGSPLKQ